VPSPAGVEPVVRAERIVSTDKKALAAGDILKMGSGHGLSSVGRCLFYLL